MSERVKQKKTRIDGMLGAVYLFLRQLADYIICMYMLLIIVGMPFYFQREQGFKTIGTSKYLFFRWTIEHIGILLMPVAVCLVIFGMLYLHRNAEGGLMGAIDRGLDSVSATDVFALLYGVAILVSYLCSPYKKTLLWGAQGWYMGFIPQLAVVISYFCISRLWVTRDWMFGLFFPTAGIVFLLGILNRFGIYPLDMKVELPNFISTVGNINWYCGYLVIVLFGGVYLLWCREPVAEETLGLPVGRKRIAMLKRAGLFGFLLVGFGSLLTQGSLSGFLALLIVLLVLFVRSADRARRMQMFWLLVALLFLMASVLWGVRQIFPEAMTFTDGVIDFLTDTRFPLAMTAIALTGWGFVTFTSRRRYPAVFFRILVRLAVGGAVLLFVAVVAMIAVNTMHPGSLGNLSALSFFTFSPDWGSNRGATWRAGIVCLQEMNLQQRLFGVGPDGMESFINDVGNERLLAAISEQFMGLRLTNAHCELMSLAINVGLFGTISFAGMMFSAIRAFLKEERHVEVIAGACGLSLIAYLANNLVSFQQTLSLATVFVVLGIGRAYTLNK